MVKDFVHLTNPLNTTDAKKTISAKSFPQLPYNP